jgi:hypothetical protein
MSGSTNVPQLAKYNGSSFMRNVCNLLPPRDLLSTPNAGSILPLSAVIEDRHFDEPISDGS